MDSALYVGRVRHRRFAPTPHAFSYRLFLAYLDLDELDTVFAGRWFWSTRRPSPMWFRRADYHGDPSLPLAEAVRRTVGEALGRTPRGPIRVLTHLRAFGHVFNPVTFYYCFGEVGRAGAETGRSAEAGASGAGASRPGAARRGASHPGAPRAEASESGPARPLEAVLVEVTNTPWQERIAHVLAADGGPVLRARHRKLLHVSPFMPLDLDWDWRLSTPGETLAVHVAASERAGRPAVDTDGSSREPERAAGGGLDAPRAAGGVGAVGAVETAEVVEVAEVAEVAGTGPLASPGRRPRLDATLALRRRPIDGPTLAGALARFPLIPLQVVAAIHWQALRLWWKGLPIHDHPRTAARRRLAGAAPAEGVR